MVVLTYSSLLGGPGISLLVRSRSPVAAGVLLGLGVYASVAALVSILRPEQPFDPGFGLWLQLLAGALAVAASLLAILALRRATLRSPATSEAPSAPPPGETLTG